MKLFSQPKVLCNFVEAGGFSGPSSFSGIQYILNTFFVDKMFHISRTKSCLEAELKKKERHLQWERENERRRVRREELEKELHRQVSGKRGEG